MSRGARMVILALVLASLTGCEETSDNAKSTTGPTITVHCDAQAPSDTTAKITCPGGTP